MIVDFEKDDMQKKLFSECLKNYNHAIAEDMTANAKLVVK